MSVAPAPEQTATAVDGLMETTGLGFTVMLVDSAAVQPFASVPVTVYRVVVDGEAVTVLPVVLLRPVAGDQLRLVVPPAVSVTLEPLQMVAPLAGLRLIVGGLFTVMVRTTVLTHPLMSVPVMV